MDDARLRRYENLLLEERQRALDALHQIEEEEEVPQSVSAGDAVRGQKTPADAASDTQEQEADFLSATRLSERITEVDEALRRLRDTPEQFGVCPSCGSPMAESRLELVPWARLCRRCAEAG